MSAPLAGITETSEGATVSLRVIPGSSRCALALAEDGSLRVRIDAPPVDGAANKRLLWFLAKKIFGIPRNRITVVRGHTGRNKLLAVSLPAGEVRRLLERALS